MPATPRRDAVQQQPQDSGSAGLKGRVVALDTGTPLRHVMLRLSSDTLRRGRAALTDGQGHYEFKDLPAGRYMLFASKGGFVTLQYGQRGPKDMGRAIELADRQILDRVDLALPRGAVITGRVVDEAGEPVADLTVYALQYQTFAGKRRLMPAGGGRGGVTNDIGQYRLFGLAPGEYYLSASTRGDFGTDPGPEDGSGYAMTYYPGTPNIAEAQHVTVGVGEEAAADIQLVATRVSKVSGTVMTSSGKPATMGMVTLTNRGPQSTGMFIGGGAAPLFSGDGTFTINGVQAGTYQLIAMASPDGEMMMPDAMESAAITINVAGQDVTGVQLTTSKGTTISGHVTFEGTPDANKAKQIHAICSPIDEESLMLTGQPAQIDDQGQFTLKGVSANCMMSALAPPGWTLKSIMLNGIDITERPIAVGSNPRPITGVEMTFTNRVTTLTGSVQTAQDQAAKEYTVVVFPEDSQKWQPPAAQRYLQRARPDQTGTFKIVGLPPARYFVAAFENVDEGREMDPEFLTQIRSVATRTELVEGGTQTLSLKINTANAGQQP